ncbi:hypothetical protein [Bryobacter aggregatus]|uniref:hypothetical protein n=1 Tax=Bryobacter aggregatus TaxID=360054 RepID=UPI0004E0DEF1|nr:hypothetical protein [Bryobacter aggregatus]
MVVPALFLLATILPPSIDDWKRTAASTAEAPLPAVAKEFGLTESESATYQSGAKKFHLAAYRLKDVTGAVALEQSLQDPKRKVFRHQNYVFQTLEGTAPRGAIDAYLYPALPKLDRSAAPNLLGYHPAKGRKSGTERLILGPESLRAFEPRIPVAAAGFDFAGELQLAQYMTPEGLATLAVLRYPNHAIAKQQFQALRQVEGATALRQGPLVAMVLPSGKPLSEKTATDLASTVQYKAEVMMDKAPEKPQPNPGKFMMGIFKLCGILLVACFVFGMIFALIRAYGRHWSGRDHEPEMTSLGI